jgi:hypothetical protein
MTVVEVVPLPLAKQLNEACQCIWVDRGKLRSRFRADLGLEAGVLETRAGLVSGSVVFIGQREADAMDRAVRLITRVLQGDACEAKVTMTAPAIAQARQRTTGGVLGFDFHLGGAIPQLIEINTNPGGLLVGFELAHAATANCDCLAATLPRLASASLGIDRVGHRIVASIADDWRRARGDTPLRTIAIVDDEPAGQYLYPEFLLYRRLLEHAGWRVLIADATALTATPDALLLDGERIDLVYNRLTDFYLAEERHSALRVAYERGLAVVTPHPAAHARFADKRLLAWLRDESLLIAAGLDPAERAVVLATIPPTEIVEPANAAELWRRRKSLFFKPVDGFAGKAAYRGDKITRTAFERVASHHYVAQAIVPTSSRRIGTAEGNESELRMDVRNFAMHGETWLRAARLYRGQTTNFRTGGGGFAPVLTLPA